MALTNEFIEAVESGKKVRVRIMLKDIMLVDPTMRQFDEMLNYAELKMNDLYDEHDGEVLKYDTFEWNESYLNHQMVIVVNNFSKERIELLRNLVKYLYKDKANKIKAEEEHKLLSEISRKQVGTGVVIAGAAVTVAGICASEGIVIAGGVVLTAAGVIMIATDKE